MDWNWKMMQAQYVRLLKNSGLKQEQIAVAGGLTGKKQHYISKIKRVPMKYGPHAEIFIRAVAGLGMPVSDFFAELEGRPSHVREQQGTSSTPAFSEPPDRDLDTVAIVNAIIDTLQRGVAAPAPISRRRRRRTTR